MYKPYHGKRGDFAGGHADFRTGRKKIAFWGWFDLVR
jgi:hypothetical protein